MMRNCYECGAEIADDANVTTAKTDTQLQVRPSLFSAESIPSKVPFSLYRYLRCEDAITLLQDSILKFSTPLDWDKIDPLELFVYSGRYKIGDKKKLVFPLREKIRISCFTEQYSCEAQWASYRTGEEPVVQIQFNTRKLLSLILSSGVSSFLGKVEYVGKCNFRGVIVSLLSSAAAKRAFLSKNPLSSKNIRYLLKPLLVKRVAFAYEKEWRLFTVGQNFQENGILQIPNLSESIENIIIDPSITNCEIQQKLEKLLPSSIKVRHSTLKRKPIRRNDIVIE